MELDTIIQWISTYKYLIIFPVAIVEGPIIMVICGFLYHLGYLELAPTYIVLLLGDLAADFVWYAVGYHGASRFIKRWGHFFSLTENRVEKLKGLFNRHQGKILVISKLTMGFGFAVATLIAAGMSKVGFKKYALINIFGGFIWTALLMMLGYYFGELYVLIDASFKKIFLVGAIGIFILALYGMGKAARVATAKKL